ncbi:MAG: tetratricopeptide repeat protein [Candidatus Omnitrophota bacterium]
MNTSFSFFKNMPGKKQNIQYLISFVLLSSIVIAVFLTYRYYKKTRPEILIRQLDYQRPDFQGLLRIIVDDYFPEHIITKYIPYYHFIFHKFKSPEAGMVLGYLYARSGQEDAALDVLKLAKAIDPDFFWINYNLGLLYFRRHQYNEAADSMKEALMAGTELAITQMTTSKVYIQIFNAIFKNLPIEAFINDVSIAQQYAVLVLAACCHAAGRHVEAVNTNIMSSLGSDRNLELLYWQGRSYLALNNYNEALSCFLKIGKDNLDEETKKLIEITLHHLHHRPSPAPDPAGESSHFTKLKNIPFSLL